MRILSWLDELETFKYGQVETNNNIQKKIIKLDSDIINITSRHDHHVWEYDQEMDKRTKIDADWVTKQIKDNANFLWRIEKLKEEMGKVPSMIKSESHLLN